MQPYQKDTQKGEKDAKEYKNKMYSHLGMFFLQKRP